MNTKLTSLVNPELVNALIIIKLHLLTGKGCRMVLSSFLPKMPTKKVFLQLL